MPVPKEGTERRSKDVVAFWVPGGTLYEGETGGPWQSINQPGALLGAAEEQECYRLPKKPVCLLATRVQEAQQAVL